MSSSQISLAESAVGFWDGFAPTPILELAQWSDDKRVLNQKNAAEPGRWRTSRTPYMRQPMADLSAHSEVEQVTLMFGTQLGKTESGNNWVGYMIDHVPGPTLVVYPTLDLAKLWSRQRLAPMVEDMPCLTEKIADSRSRDSRNTILLKEYDGGILRIGGANSAASLRAMPVKNLYLDEADAYPMNCEGEGDPIELARRRTETFARKKILVTSTPTRKGSSAVEREFEDGSAEYFHVPCPHCDEYLVLDFDNLKYELDDDGDVDDDSVGLACVDCGSLINERHKTGMLEAGKWIATKKNRFHKSYQLSSLYSPLGWESWPSIIRKYLKAEGVEDLIKTFWNTILGLPYEEKAKELEPGALQKRAEDYRLKVCPLGCLALTAGVDVQDNRLEVYVWGHGERARWMIDYAIIYGSPALSSTWQELDNYLRAPFDHVSGQELTISATAIDSGGHHTQDVYDFCRLRKARKVFAIKGASTKGRPILGKPTKVDLTVSGQVVKNGAEVWSVGTDTAKDLIYNLLELQDQDAEGYVHFSSDLPKSFYTQLTSEKKTYAYVKGFLVYSWELPKGKRNEALDCLVYALAAFWRLGLNRWRPAQWKQLEDLVQPATADLFGSIDQKDREAARVKSVEQVAPKKSTRPGRPGRPGKTATVRGDIMRGF